MRFFPRPWSPPFNALRVILPGVEPAVSILHHPLEPSVGQISYRSWGLAVASSFIIRPWSWRATMRRAFSAGERLTWQWMTLSWHGLTSRRSCSSTPATKPPRPSWPSAISGSASSLHGRRSSMPICSRGWLRKRTRWGSGQTQGQVMSLCPSQFPCSSAQSSCCELFVIAYANPGNQKLPSSLKCGCSPVKTPAVRASIPFIGQGWEPTCKV